MDQPSLPAAGAGHLPPDPLNASLPETAGMPAVETAILNWLWRREHRIADTPARLMVALRDGALAELCAASLRRHFGRLDAAAAPPPELRLHDPVSPQLPQADILIGPQHALIDALPAAEARQAQWLLDAPPVPVARRACQRLAPAFAAGRVRVLPATGCEADAVLPPLPLHAATALLDAHRPGTTTLGVPATLAQVRSILRELQQLAPGTALVAVHPCFRSAHRAALAASLLNAPAGGRILVATPTVAAQLQADRRLVALDGGEAATGGHEAPVLNVLWRLRGSEAAPQSAELCPAPPVAVRKLRRERWLWDRAAGRWQHCQPSTALPAGSIVRLNAEEGGYDATLGWMPHARLTVVPALTAD